MKPYRLSQALDKETRLLITKKFPGCLEVLLCPVTGSIPLSLTTRQAFDYIKKDVQATSTGNMRHQELLQALIMREYEPGITTAETYFRLCEIDQHCMRAIRAAKVPDAQIMVGYKSPFERLWIVPLCKSLTMHGPRSRRHHHMPRLPLPTGTLKPTTVKSLREYYIDSKASNKKHQAYAVDEITAALDQLQSKVELNTQHVHILANTQDQMLAQPEAYSTHYVPSVVSVTTATTPSELANSAADTRFDKLEGSIESIVQQSARAGGRPFPLIVD